MEFFKFEVQLMHYNPAEALARIDNDTALLSMLISVFTKECPGYIAKLQAASESQNITALGDAAHNVKGASASIGFEECRALAETLEVACRQSGVKSIAYFQDSTAKLVNVLKNCESTLKGWVEQQNRSAG
ncbi:MAG TPA: Hpt domain-containing protein [Limnobacter sp.]|nr:Hpt domain-containing protein [Limnobacter sp.]